MIIYIFTESEKQESDKCDDFTSVVKEKDTNEQDLNISTFSKIIMYPSYLNTFLYIIETKTMESDEVHHKPIMIENGEEQGGRRGKGKEGDRSNGHDESEGEIEEKPQSQRERDQHQLNGQRVGEEVQELITEKGESPINRIRVTKKTYTLV